MTLTELDALPDGTTIYLPTEWEVLIWQIAGRVHDRHFYTLLHPPDADGVIYNRRPIYVDAVQMLNATLDEQAAWRMVMAGLEERIDWIFRQKLTPIQPSKIK